MSGMKPSNKVTAGVIAGAVVLIAAWAARAFAKVEIPIDIQAALQILVTFGVQWAVPDAPGDAQDTQPQERGT